MNMSKIALVCLLLGACAETEIGTGDAGPDGEDSGSTGGIGSHVEALHNYSPTCYTHNGSVAPTGMSMRTVATMLASYYGDDVQFTNAHSTGQVAGADLTAPIGSGSLGRPTFRAKGHFERSACYSNGTQNLAWFTTRCGGNSQICFNNAAASSAEYPAGYSDFSRTTFLVWCNTDNPVPGAYTRVSMAGYTFQDIIYPGCTNLPGTNTCNTGAWGDLCKCGETNTPSCL